MKDNKYEVIKAHSGQIVGDIIYLPSEIGAKRQKMGLVRLLEDYSSQIVDVKRNKDGEIEFYSRNSGDAVITVANDGIKGDIVDEVSAVGTAVSPLQTNLSRLQEESLKKYNLVKNGDFSNGTSDWTNESADLVVSNNTLIGTKKAGGITRISQAVPVIEGHKYYISCDLTKISGSFDKFNISASGVFTLIEIPVSTGETVHFSRVITSNATSTSTLWRFLYPTNSTSSEGDKFSVKNVMVVDLTELLGAGNEGNVNTLSTNFVPNMIQELRETQPNRKMIPIAGNGSSIDNYVLKLNIHRGHPDGDIDSQDIFMNNTCKTDFSDLRFKDSKGNVLDYYIHSSGNYELIHDNNRLGEHNIMYNGAIYASTIPDKPRGLYKSKDNGQTYETLYTCVSAANMYSAIVFINSKGHLFFTDGNLFVRSADDGATWTTVMDLTSTDGWVKFHNVAEDASGNLFVGQYQEATSGAKIMKSTDDGDTWTEVYNNTDPLVQHIHGIAIDPWSGYIYAGLDGAGNGGKRVIRSVDGGENWTDLWINAGGDFVTMLFVNENLRYLCGGNASTNCSLHKTTDDITFTPILPTGASIQDAQILGNYIYCLASEYGSNAYSQIYRVNLDGTDPKTIWIDDLNTRNSFVGYHNTWTADTPDKAFEKHLIVGSKKYSGTRCKNSRLYDGGHHYQALVYIKIPNVPADGTYITVESGDPYKTSRSESSKFTDFETVPTPILHFKLDEGTGITINDIAGSRQGTLVHTEGKGSWANEYGRRFGGLYPWVTKSGNSYNFNGGDYFTFPTDSALENINKNSTILAWIKTSNPTVPQTIISKGSGSNTFSMQVRATNYWVAGVGCGTNGNSGNKGQLINGEWHLVGLILHNTTPIEASFIHDARIDTRKELSTQPVTANNLDFAIGAELDGTDPFYGNIAEVMIYDRELTQQEIQQIYENRPIFETMPEVDTTLV